MKGEVVLVRSIRRTGLGILIAILLWCVPSVAMAGWPFAGTRGATVLGFGAEYPAADGSTATHRGVDIAGAPGDSVRAPLAGTVSFAGRVPGIGGGTILAVTLQTESGDVTLLPLSGCDVVRGQSLAQGEAVGSLAEGGDGSYAGAHLHVGLRTGSLYLDPAVVLGVPTQPSEAGDGATQEAGVGVAAPSIVPDGAGADAGVGSAPQVHEPAATESPAAGQAGAKEAPPVAVAQGTGVTAGSHSAQGMRELAPGVTLATNGVAASESLVQGAATKTGRALAAGGGVAQAATAAVMGAGPGAALSRIAALVRSGARVLAMAGIALLAALGALWPLWHVRAGEGPGKVLVSAVRDDVAAVASR